MFRAFSQLATEGVELQQEVSTWGEKGRAGAAGGGAGGEGRERGKKEDEA